jgi:geranylgeranylglycerol-phosphate geranylgeranyltransferase
MSELGGYVRLTRPINCVMMATAVIVGATLANPNIGNNSWPSLIYGFFTGFILTAASMTINDYYDRHIDATNEPNRPIPSGLIKPRDALIFAAILSMLGFVAAYLTNTPCLVTAIIAWTVFAAYTTVGKKSGLPGNLLVSTCVAIPFIYGMAIVAEVKLNVLLFASMAFLSNTGREITKGIVDVKGDATANVKTLAVRYGEKKAAIVAASFYVFSILLSLIPWLLNLVSFWFVPIVLIFDIGLAALSFLLLKDYSRENARRIKNNVLLWFIIGLLAFIIGAIR